MVTGGSSQPHSQNPTLIMARTKKTAAPASSTATIGFEAKLWLTADKLRNNMDAAEYKHVVLGLIFLKYISDTIALPFDAALNGPPFFTRAS